MKKVRAQNANAVPSAHETVEESTVEFRVPPEGRADTPKIVLCIGGTDPSGGAGLSADARAVMAQGAIPCGVVSAVVVQNTRGVAHIEAVSPDLFYLQLENLLEDIRPDAVKIGLLPSLQHVETVAHFCDSLLVPLIVDTVFSPTRGAAFCDEETIDAFKKLLLPRAELVTPNRAEAEILCGFTIETENDVRHAAHHIRDNLRTSAVLIKGGHFAGDDATDFLLTTNGETLLRSPRLDVEVRGTGCQLASAIAAGLAQNRSLEDATARAKIWLYGAMMNSVAIGEGRRVTKM